MIARFDSAVDQRDHHRERQNPELRQLNGHREEVVAADKLVADGQQKNCDQRGEEDDQYGLCGMEDEKPGPRGHGGCSLLIFGTRTGRDCIGHLPGHAATMARRRNRARRV